MNYHEAIEAIITSDEARAEIEKHGLSFADFVSDEGKREEYSGREVLAWLGY
jgi:hypothetical protein